MRKNTLMDVPGQYWTLYHKMPEAIMYGPSYLLAAVRAAELERKIEEKLDMIWGNKKRLEPT